MKKIEMTGVPETMIQTPMQEPWSLKERDILSMIRRQWKS